MNFVISAATDVGIRKKINQDRMFAQRIETPYGPLAFAILCDGMGGLEKGEVASSALVQAFSEWFGGSGAVLSDATGADRAIRKQWTGILDRVNAWILEYGHRSGCKLGTTATAILLTENRYYLMNIGDTRAYEVMPQGMRQLTVDHTLVQREVERGNLTKEQAEHAPNNHILTRCIGVEAEVYPDLFFGDTKKGAIYLLCSDGFRHRVSEQEIQSHLCGDSAGNGMDSQLEKLIELCKQRGETDNISVITVRCTDNQGALKNIF